MSKGRKTRQSYIAGAAIISFGGFVSKALGALYRIPLTALLTSAGMGIYQMVYPLYCILLTLSASGIPAGLSGLVSSGRGAGAEKRAFAFYGAAGFIGALLMFAFSDVLAKILGEAAAASCCRALAPAVFFTSIISVVRGYFQGKGNMIPTAATEICEQAVKVAAGCALAFAFRADMQKAVTGAVFAVSVSEAVSALLAVGLYLRGRGVKPLYREREADINSLLAYTLPLTLTALAMPLSQFAESVAAVRLLKEITPEAVSTYGVFSGCALTIINLPVSLTYGFAVAGVPQISPMAARGDIKGARKKCLRALLITCAFALPCAAALFIFAPLAANIIFRSLSPGEKQLLVTLVRIMAVNAVTLSAVQTSSACLTALGKPSKSALSQWLSAAARVVLTVILIKFTPLGVTGAAISANCSYLLAVLINFWYIMNIKKFKKTGAENEHNACRSGNGRRRYFFGGKKGA